MAEEVDWVDMAADADSGTEEVEGAVVDANVGDAMIVLAKGGGNGAWGAM